jgi:cellulose synthase/poly-beta-1,6-N-acetylglucosamine synthase-like glycosyltransferase
LRRYFHRAISAGWAKEWERKRTLPNISVIIPAHNEEDSISGCLRSLVEQSIRHPLKIIVVANGCVDATGARARAMADEISARGFDFEVAEIPRGSKPNALNHGETYVTGGIRIYLDADVRLSPDAIEAVAETLAGERALLTAPAVSVSAGRAWSTRCYAKIWQALPVVRTGVIGAGIYAVSEQGRRRWASFPDIHSDDKYVRLCFDVGERQISRRGSFVIRMPEGLHELISVRARWCRGNRELAVRFPLLARRDRRNYLAVAAMLVKRPDLWSALPAFLAVYGTAYLLSRFDLRQVPRWRRAVEARKLMASSEAVRGEAASHPF